MADIYDQHKAAFAHVSAYVIMKDGERIATVAFKFCARVTCYAHVLGLPMARGFAGGGGYDRQSAAAEVAFGKSKPDEDYQREPETLAILKALQDCLRVNDGADWSRRIENAGFKVWQAV